MPFIPKEEYDALPENVREIIRQQHAYFRELLKQNGGTKAGGPKPRNVNFTRTQAGEENLSDQGHSSEEEQEVQQDTNGKPVEGQEQILDTFQQFLHKARKRQITVCHTTRTVYLPRRLFNAQFSGHGTYG